MTLIKMKRNINKMKKILCVVLILSIIAIAVFEKSRINEQSQFSQNELLSEAIIGNDFYYSQMTEYEREVYSEIVRSIEEYEQKVIPLREPMSDDQYNLIQNALLNSGQDYFYVKYLFPLNENKQPPTVNEDIYYYVTPFIVTKTLDFMENIVLENGEVIEQYKDGFFESLPQLDESTLEQFSKLQTLTIEALEQAVADMPPEITGKTEAFYYFAEWLKLNMKYDIELLNMAMDPNYDILSYSYEDQYPITGMWASSILEGKGLCGGLAAVLVRLCNLVGIDAYMVDGIARNSGIRHAWVAVCIGDEILYTDPTANVRIQEVIVRDKKQMERGYIFDERFNY
jgi:transglutaminase-like putative cysteine protease